MSWTKKTLGNVVDLKRGFDLPASRRVDGDFPVYSSSGLTGTHDNCAVKGPCVITGRYGTIGKVFYSGGDCWPLNTALYSCDFKGNNPRYIFYLLQTVPWQEYATASAVPGINRNHVNTHEATIPDIETQRRIANILDGFTDKIALNNQINGYLEDAMQTLYHNVFANDNSRTVGSIYDIAEVVYGAAFKSTLFNEGGDGFPLIRIRDLSTFKPQCYTTEENPKRTIINPGDVIAGMDAEFRPTFWLGDRALLNQRVCYFKPPENSCITPSYLLCALKPLLAFIQNYATGTTVAHLGKTDLEALDVPMPDEERLSQFTMNAEPMRLMIVSNAQENRRLEALRDSLLPRLMSGEIDVSKVDLTQLNSHLSAC